MKMTTTLMIVMMSLICGPKTPPNQQISSFSSSITTTLQQFLSQMLSFFSAWLAYTFWCSVRNMYRMQWNSRYRQATIPAPHPIRLSGLWACRRLTPSGSFRGFRCLFGFGQRKTDFWRNESTAGEVDKTEQFQRNVLTLHIKKMKNTSAFYLRSSSGVRRGIENNFKKRRKKRRRY